MNLFRNKAVLCCSLLLYTLLLTAVLLYVRFPAEKFDRFCLTQLEQLIPESDCSVERLSFKFPLSLYAEQITCSSRQGKKQPLGSIDQLTITPQLLSPISRFHVTVTAWEGKHSFSFLRNRTEQQFTLEDIQLHNLNLARLPFLRNTFGREITGFLSGNGSYNGGWAEKGSPAEGRGSMTIEKGSFGLLLPIFSLKKIDLKKLTADLVFQKNSLQLQKGIFHGQELKGEFSGNLALQSPLQGSGFAFKGELEPLPPLLKKSKYAQNMVIQLKKQHGRATLPFLLQGSVESPQFKFDS